MTNIVAIAIYLVCFALATVAAIEDTRSHLLRNIYTLPIIAIAVFGLGAISLADDQSGRLSTDMGIGAAWFAGPWLITHLVTPKVIGFGDVKLATGLGLLIGWLSPTLGLIGMFIASAIYGLTAVAAKAGKTDQLPFGPALVGGAAIAIIIGLL